MGISYETQPKIIFIAILFGEEQQQMRQHHIGCIEVDCNPKAVVKDAYENARCE
jgi:hypothetical protein